MKINKKLLSFFLAVLMVFSTFGDTVYALSSSNETRNRSLGTEIKGKVIGDKEVFTFTIPKKSQRQSIQARSFRRANRMMTPLRAPSGTTDTTVEVTATGLGSNPFDWSALPSSEFKITVEWETTDSQSHEKELTPAITSAGTFTYNVGWPTDGTLKGTATLVTSFNQNIEVRVIDVSSTSTPDGQAGLKFTIDLKELAEPRANVKYVDPYGRKLTDPADLPSSSDTMPNVTAEELTGVTIPLPKTSEQINMRSSDDIDADELHAAARGLTYKVGGKTDQEKIKIGEKTYLVDISQPNPKEIGQILMVSQPDVIIPPTKPNSSDPVDVADGYVRLTFDANEKVEAGKTGIKGKHTAGAYAGQQLSYIDVRNDVKNPVKYDDANLKAAIGVLSTTGTKDVNGETKTFAQKAKAPWTPAVPTDTTPVTTATYNAQYEKSAAEQVTELGGLNPKTIKVWKDDSIDWKSGVEPAVKNSDAVWALIEEATVTDITVSKRDSKKAGKFSGKVKVTFEDTSSLEVDNQMLIVSEHVVTIDPNSTDPDAPQKEDLPRDKITVIFKAGEGIDNINTNGKTTYAKPNATLADTDFPANITYKDGYKNEVTWEPTDHKVDTNNRRYYDGKRKTFTFKASADKTVIPTNPDDPQTPQGYVLVTFEK
ncbi:hypothetical protein QP555_08540, partial [Peptoniphilus lacrimalis]|uniref:hypothetical protein n=1 Tax=Peptoniphilus lacrimalis TaxID=33031 RepID=UPI00254A8D90